MERIRRSCFLYVETRLINCGMKSPGSGDQFDHFENYFILELVFFS